MTDAKNDEDTPENRKQRRARETAEREAAERAEQEKAQNAAAVEHSGALMDPVPTGDALDESIAHAHADPVNPLPAGTVAQHDPNASIQVHPEALVPDAAHTGHHHRVAHETKVNPLEPKVPPQVTAAKEGVELPPELRHQSEVV